MDYCGVGVSVWLISGDVSAWPSPIFARRSARFARCCSALLFLSEAIGVDEATGMDVAASGAGRVAVGCCAAAVGEIAGRLGFWPRFSFCAACAASRRFGSACLGEKTFFAGLDWLGLAAVSGVTEGCSPAGRGRATGAELDRKVAAGVGNAGAWRGLLGKGAGVPTGVAFAVETAGFTA